MYNSDIRDNIKDITGKSFKQIVDLLTVEQIVQMKNYMRDELVLRGINVNKRNIRFDDFVRDLLGFQEQAKEIEETTKKAWDAENFKKKAKEELEKAKENHRSAILSLKDSFMKEKESLTESYKKDMQNMKDEHDAEIMKLMVSHSKEVEKLNYRYQHEIVKRKEEYYRREKLEKELKKEQEDKLTCLRHQHYEELKEAQDIAIKILQMVRDNIATAYDASNQDIKRLIDKEIFNNRIYSLDYFIEKGSTGKTMLRDAFQECLNEDFPTWLDVLTRLYCYIQVPFLSERFQHAGIDLSKVVIAFQITCQMLKQMKMDLIYPHLFMEEFNEGIHIAYQYGTSIISYLPDADIDIKKVAKPNMIVDMRSVGFCMDGEIKKLPSVIVFH